MYNELACQKKKKEIKVFNACLHWRYCINENCWQGIFCVFLFKQFPCILLYSCNTGILNYTKYECRNMTKQSRYTYNKLSNKFLSFKHQWLFGVPFQLNIIFLKYRIHLKEDVKYFILPIEFLYTLVITININKHW